VLVVVHRADDRADDEKKQKDVCEINKYHTSQKK